MIGRNSSSPIQFPEPIISPWFFLDKGNIEELMKITSEEDIIRYSKPALKQSTSELELNNVADYFLSLINFCECANYNVEKFGASLSIFYQTHLYFTSKYGISPDKVYNYFQEIIMHYAMPFPPNYIDLFTMDEVSQLTQYFFTTYMKVLPLLASIHFPSVNLRINYDLPPPPPIVTKTKGKKKNSK